MCTTRLVTYSNLWISRLSSLALLVLYCATATHAATTTVWATPHDSYSSSIGVLGCKVDTDRIAYWPGSVDCNNLCVSLSYGDRKVKLLRIDQSQGAHDISYDAWNYLTTGHGANDRPAVGGPIEMQTEDLDAAECKDLIHTEGHKLPLSAANSMNFLASCLDHKNGSWVGENYILYNILDSICTWGYDEPCELDWPSANQAQCKHALGTPNTLKDDPVYDIKYPSGNKVIAGSGEVVKTGGTPWGDVGGTGQENAATRGLVAGSSATLLIVWIMTLMSDGALCWI
ncbi:hypothetical protein N0V85_007933 [Neurospora sp. IMI 360204]|nr:hypothetical protein N0V85_007933 [Neurospora sp. IMI 360204]